MDTANTKYKVRECSQCQEDTEYFCLSCLFDLCYNCKENHAEDFKTNDHCVVKYLDKFNYMNNNKKCFKHMKGIYTIYCENCKIPICLNCTEHITHRWQAEKLKRQQHIKTFSNKKYNACNFQTYSKFLMDSVVADVENCKKVISQLRSNMKIKAKRLIDNVRFSRFEHITLKQMGTLKKHILNAQIFEHLCDYSTTRPVQFLLMKKHVFDIKCIPYCMEHITESFNNVAVMNLLCEIQISGGKKRQAEKKRFLNMMDHPELQGYRTVPGTVRCCHISFVTLEHVWVSDGNSLILTSPEGENLKRIKDVRSEIGFHTVNSRNELLFIDRYDDINKLSTDMTTITLFIKNEDSSWNPICLYWSLYSEDLLVASSRDQHEEGRVTRYNMNAKIIQTIQDSNKEQKLYRKPCYVIDNNNGDIVVSDTINGVVVTEFGGRHRFSYRGHPSGSILWSCGICTNVLSQILVCDKVTSSVQMIDKDGQFLSHLLIRPPGIFDPYSLKYDVNSDCLWIGSGINNNVSVYRYVNREYNAVI